MAVPYCFGMQLSGRDDAQLRLGLAVVFVEDLVGEVVGPAEQEVGVEGAELAQEDVSAEALDGALGGWGRTGGLTPAT